MISFFETLMPLFAFFIAMFQENYFHTNKQTQIFLDIFLDYY